jgi:hypothetical protein
LDGEQALSQQLSTIANKRGQASSVSVAPMTAIPQVSAQTHSRSSIDAGALINAPAKRVSGHARPPIREQDVIDQLSPLLQKDQKTMGDLRQESENLFSLVKRGALS